jgi:hypothetical protein
MNILRRIPFWAAVALLIYMPFHIFLAQSLSLATGGLEVWKVGKDVFLAVAALFTICLVWRQRAGDKRFWWLVGAALAYFGLHILLWALHSELYQKSAILGTIYNTRLPAFLVLGYGAALLTPVKFVFSSVLKIILGVSTAVALLGVIQYFLPSDLLSHVGYGVERGTKAAFFIEDRPDLPRIMSTLREPNALGAYLILPLAAITSLLLKTRTGRVRYMFGSMFLLHIAAIFLTFSRSAWLGTLLVIALVAGWHYKKYFGMLKRFWPVAAVAVLVCMTVAFVARDTPPFQRYIIHSDPSERVADLDSNDLHILLAKQGLEGIAAQPLGHGPGTAGLVSIQNPAGGQLTENYYIQIGYEVGVVGLAVFIALNIWVYRMLCRRGGQAAIILCSSFWAYVLINMLLHSWSNEAVAAQWWILAGLAAVAGDGNRPVGNIRP